MQPNRRRGAASLANLRRGGPGRSRLSEARKQQDKAARHIAQRLLLDPVYQRNLQDRLRSGRLQPGVEVTLYHYAWGKPTQAIETTQVVPVCITHEYAE